MEPARGKGAPNPRRSELEALLFLAAEPSKKASGPLIRHGDSCRRGLEAALPVLHKGPGLDGLACVRYSTGRRRRCQACPSSRWKFGVPAQGCRAALDEEEAQLPLGFATPDPFLARYGGRLLGGANAASHGDPGIAQDHSVDVVAKNDAVKDRLVQRLSIFDGFVDSAHYLPVFYLFKDVMHLDPVGVSMAMGMSSIPWILKPLLAMLTDRFPAAGARRTPYLVGGVIIIAGTYAAVSAASTYSSSVLLLAANTLGRCSVSVVLQAMVVEIARPQGDSGSKAAVGDFFLLKTTGALLGACASSVLVANLGARGALRCCAALPALVMMAAINYEVTARSEPVMVRGGETNPTVANVATADTTETVEEQASLSKLVPVVSSPIFWGPLAFLFAYCASPNYDDSLYYFYINRLQFSPTIIGELKMAQEIAKLLGIVVYRYGLRHVPDRLYMVLTTSISFPLYLTPMLLTTGVYKSMHVSPQVLALSGELVREVFLNLQLMPVFARTAAMCPRGLESTISAVVISTINISRACSKVSSAGLMMLLGVTAKDFSNLSALIVSCGCLGLAPLALSQLIPLGREPDPQEAEQGADSELEEIGTVQALGSRGLLVSQRIAAVQRANSSRLGSWSESQQGGRAIKSKSQVGQIVGSRLAAAQTANSEAAQQSTSRSSASMFGLSGMIVAA